MHPEKSFMLGVIIGVVMTFSIWIYLHKKAVNSWRQEATKRGFAEWVIADKLTGEKEWRWKEGKEGKE